MYYSQTIRVTRDGGWGDVDTLLKANIGPEFRRHSETRFVLKGTYEWRGVRTVDEERDEVVRKHIPSYS